MSFVLAAMGVVAAIYQLLAIFACLRFRSRRDTFAPYHPGVSILKPICGADPDFYRAIRSHALLDYPELEIVFAVREPKDTALPYIQRLQEEFPGLTIRVVMVTTVTPNAKVGSLIDALEAARYPVIVVNDSDITVSPEYLIEVVAPLGRDSRIGLVTCLYRASARSFAGRWEALGIATDFAPSALVAQMIGAGKFGFGSTLAFRAADLKQLGGFEAISGYLADDYQLGKLFRNGGYGIHLSRHVVETSLKGEGIWQHQLRWARTIRVSEGVGYAGLPVTNATVWIAFLLWNQQWWAGLGLLALRYLAAWVAAFTFNADFRLGLLTPLRDLWGFAVWGAGLVGNTVTWRGARFRLTKDGRLHPAS